MNEANLLAVADAMERHAFPDLGYNQIDWLSNSCEPDMSGHECETTACLAGWAYAVEIGRSLTLYRDLISISQISDRAQAFLGLDRSEANALFRASPLWDDPTAAQAVATLRYAAAHGVIDWRAANPGAR